MTRLYQPAGTKLNQAEMDRLKEMYSRQRTDAADLIARLQEEKERQVDFITDTRSLQMLPLNDELIEQLPEIPQSERTQPVKPRVALFPKDTSEDWYQEIGPVAANAHAHQQIGTTLQIPRPYYQRMLEHDPALLAENVNHWLDAEPKRRLVRTMQTNGDPDAPKMAFARGWLSNKYRRLDAVDLADTVMPMFLDDRSDWMVTQCGVTDVRVHIEARIPTIVDEVTVGDEVSLAVKITTSDVGCGALTVAFGIYRLVCANIMVVPSFTKRQVHIGGVQKELVDILSDKTLRAEDKLTMQKMKELVSAMASEDQFRTILETLRGAARTELQDPVAATEILTTTIGLKPYETREVQKQLMADNTAPTMWSLANALTATARDLEFERKSELEKAAGRMMTETKSWPQYTNAVAA